MSSAEVEDGLEAALTGPRLIKGKEASGGLLNPVEVDAFFPHHCLKTIIDRVNAHSEL